MFIWKIIIPFIYSIKGSIISVFILIKYSNKDNWFFLRGDIADIVNLSEQGFFLSAALLPMGHSTRFVLVDKDSNIRKYYEGTVESNIYELQSDIVTLLNQE